MEKVILHCDMNNFFASVELLDRPELRDFPVAVSGNPEHRHGIILAKNQIAKNAGVVTAETINQARRKCPDLVLIPPHFEKYKKYYKLINGIYGRFTDLIEPFSIDESWLDVTASRTLFGTGPEIADKIRETVKTELGLTLSCGVSYNKVFAKMGSDYKKPDATTVITRDNFRELLWPLPVSELFFVGRSSAEKLRALGISTIGDLASSDVSWLESQFGKHGRIMYEYANGLDDEPVAPFSEKRKIKSVGNGITFKRDLTGLDDIMTAVTSISDIVAGRLRKYCLKANGIKVDIKDPTFKSISHQTVLASPTNITGEIGKAALDIIKSHWNIRNPIRLITITAINLTDEDGDEQLTFFACDEKQRENSENLDRAIDRIRAKYGGGSVTYGRIIGNDLGIDLESIRKE